MTTTMTVPGTTATATASTTGWGLTSTALTSSSINMTMSAFSGHGVDGILKSGLVGAASGIFAGAGGFGLVNQGLAGKLAYQAIGTAGRSVGRNWAAGEDLFSKLTVGVGPVNLVFGKDVTLKDYLWANAGNLSFNAIGLANLAFGGGVQFDKPNLTAIYSDGLIGKIYSNSGIAATGAHSIFSDSKMNLSSSFYRHELGHLWHSRAMGNSFLANYFGQGLFPLLMGESQYYVNFYELFAELW